MRPYAQAAAAAPLERAWLALASAALVAAAVCALVVAAARTPWLGEALHLQSAFAPALVVHVVLATVVWLLGAGAARWVALAPPNRTFGWAVLAIAALGAAALPAALLTAAPVRLFNYLPLLAHPLFLSGLAWFATALMAVVAVATWATIAGRRGESDPDHRGLAGFSLRCALLPAWTTAATIALGWATRRDAGPALEHGEWLFWAPGHSLQFIFAALMVAAWIAHGTDRRPDSRALRVAVLLTALPSLLALLPFAWYPLDSAPFRRYFTGLMALGAWAGPLWAALLLERATPGAIGRTPHLALSVALFALGAFVGALIDADTTTVPAHYHGTVGAATLVAMSLVSTRLGVRPVARDPLPWLYFGGLALIVIGFAVAGGQSTPRKLPIAADGAVARAGLALMSAGAAAAIASVLWFGARVARALLGVRRPVGASPARIDRRARAIAATALSVVLLGGLLAWFGGRTNSQASAKAALAALPNDAAAEVRLRFDQGVVMLHARQYDHAVTAFHRVLALAPQMPEAYVNMGFALLGQRNHREAADFFAAAIELRRDQLNAYYGLAVALEGSGDLRGAIGAMRAYVHLTAPTDPYRRKAEAALWEWESQLAQASPDPAPKPAR